jgi:L-aspartate oxidase
LASNSLLEAMVFAHRCYMDVASPRTSFPTFANSVASQGGALDPDASKNPPGFLGTVPDWNAHGSTEPKEMILITQSLKELQLIMSDYVGIVRNNTRLQRAMRRLDLLWEETEQLYASSTLSPQLLELRNMITVGYLIVKGASFRKESRGLHFNTDYPGKSNLVQNIVL